MNTKVFAPPTTWRRGAAYSRTTIIACLYRNQGCGLVCTTCGHEFLVPKPLSDESEPIDQVELAKAIYLHDCATENQADRKRWHNGR